MTLTEWSAYLSLSDEIVHLGGGGHVYGFLKRIMHTGRTTTRRFLLCAPALGAAGALWLVSVAHAQQPSPSTRPAAPVIRSTNDDPRAVDAIYQSGFLVRHVSRGDPALIVTVGGGGSRISDVQWKAITAARDQIVELDLRRSHIVDSDIAIVQQLTHLKRLHLEANDISDAGVAALVNLKNVEYLNLYGNGRVTDASLERLAAMASLKRVYLWQTAATPDGVKTLRAKRADLLVGGDAASRPTE